MTYSRVHLSTGHMTPALHMRLPAILMGAATRTILVVMVLGLTVGYIFQVSNLTTGGYEVAKLETNAAQLAEENERLRAEIATYQSMSSVEKRLETLGMVKATNIKYVKVSDGAVAQR